MSHPPIECPLCQNPLPVERPSLRDLVSVVELRCARCGTEWTGEVREVDLPRLRGPRAQ